MFNPSAFSNTSHAAHEDLMRDARRSARRRQALEAAADEAAESAKHSGRNHIGALCCEVTGPRLAET